MGIPQIQQQEIARRKNWENSPSQPGKVRCGFFLTAANQQPEKNPGISRNCPWHFRKIGYNRSVPQGNIEDLCNGSTPDSDSVCGGSNPSSSAIRFALDSSESRGFFLSLPLLRFRMFWISEADFCFPLRFPLSAYGLDKSLHLQNFSCLGHGEAMGTILR